MAEAKQTLSDKFFIGKKAVELEFDSENATIRWKLNNWKKALITTEVAVADVLSVDATGAAWVLDYVRKTRTRWTPCKVVFSGEEEKCQRWSATVKDAVATAASSRPKKLLIFINPRSGNSGAVKSYHKTAAPLFAKAGVSTEVIVTEDGEQSKRVLADYDLTKVDGLVAMGGDGTYMRLVNALQHRLMADAGKDVVGPDTELVEPDIPVGILPGGTGNGMAKMMTLVTSTDLQTAALFIILGETTRVNMMTLYVDNKFLCYSILHVMYGAIGDCVKTSEENRKLGKMRYLYALAKHFAKLRRFDMKINYRLYGEDVWDSFEGRYIMLNIIVYRMENKFKNTFLQAPLSVYTLDATVGRSGLLKHLMQLYNFNSETFNMAGLTERSVSAVKVDLPDTLGGSTIKNPGGSTAENPKGSAAENPGANTEENPGGSTAENPEGSTEENSGGSTTENPGDNTAENPEGSTVENPGGSTAENPEGNTVENPGASTAENPEGSTEENSGGSTTENSGASTAENPEGSTVENPGASAETPGANTEENPGGNTVENPGASTAENPEGSTVENPGASTAGNPGGSTAENPGAGTTEHVFNVDGEAYFLGPCQLLIKLHHKHLKVFGRILE